MKSNSIIVWLVFYATSDTCITCRYWYINFHTTDHWMQLIQQSFFRKCCFCLLHCVHLLICFGALQILTFSMFQKRCHQNRQILDTFGYDAFPMILFDVVILRSFSILPSPQSKPPICLISSWWIRLEYHCFLMVDKSSRHSLMATNESNSTEKKMLLAKYPR